MKSLLILLALLQVSLCLKAQTKTHNVINTSGTERRSSAVILTDNLGEPFISAISGSKKITQGFLQPPTNGKLGSSVSAIFQGLKCLDKEDDAFIELTLTHAGSTPTVSYIWHPSNACPRSDCERIDSLRPGIYRVTVAIAYKSKTGAVIHDTLRPAPFVIANADKPCLIKVYNGITANDDGIDDVFQISNIGEFPENRVSIYNRWGELLFDVRGYNEKDPERSWPDRTKKNSLTAGTYFYVIELGNGSQPVKGWVELLKN